MPSPIFRRISASERTRPAPAPKIVGVADSARRAAARRARGRARGRRRPAAAAARPRHRSLAALPSTASTQRATTSTSSSTARSVVTISMKCAKLSAAEQRQRRPCGCAPGSRGCRGCWPADRPGRRRSRWHVAPQPLDHELLQVDDAFAAAGGAGGDLDVQQVGMADQEFRVVAQILGHLRGA